VVSVHDEEVLSRSGQLFGDGQAYASAAEYDVRVFLSLGRLGSFLQLDAIQSCVRMKPPLKHMIVVRAD
jgi:hypothetical protein